MKFRKEAKELGEGSQGRKSRKEVKEGSQGRKPRKKGMKEGSQGVIKNKRK